MTRHAPAIQLARGDARNATTSPTSRGVAIQLYGALIATLLLMLLTKERPTKRQLEAIQLYFMGFATEDELLRALDLQKS